MKFSITLFGLFLFIFTSSFAQTKYFVDKSTGSDINDGLSWNNAFENLQTALFSINNGDTIWVAQGIYYPDEGNLAIDNDRTFAFDLSSGVQIYGGFAGGEISLAQRDWEHNLCILSGDLLQNDGPNFTNYTDNAYHVVTCRNQTLAPLFDGFIITGGNAVDTLENTFGGGMFNLSSSPKIYNCMFKKNYAHNAGGGMYNLDADVQVEYCQFIQNHCIGSGGGMYSFISTITLKENLFQSNRTKNTGGGLANFQSTTSLDKCVFVDNHAEAGFGGAVFNAGGANALLVNCSFLGNTAFYGGAGCFANAITVLYNGLFLGNKAFVRGGGIYNEESNTSVVNCSFAGNSAVFSGGAVHNHISNPTIYNTVIWNNKDTSGIGTAQASIANALGSVPFIASSLIQNITSGTSNNNLNGVATANDSNYPQFIIESNPALAPFLDGNLRVHSSSPLIDSGDGSATFITIDLDCLDRSNGGIDLGAYENPNVNCPQDIILDQNYSPLQGIYEAVHTIDVTDEVSVSPSSSVILNAMNINLNPTLTIELGAIFTINNNGCTN